MQDIERAAAQEFDRWADAGRGESMHRGHLAVTTPVIDRWTLDADSRVLDVGCGNGWAVRLLLERGAGDGIGVDLSPRMIEEARAHGRGSFHVASGAELPLPDDHVSHVLSVESLYYYPDPVAALREWARVARPGAELAIVIELYAENRGSAIWAEVLDVHAHLWSEARWLEALAEAGWEARAERILHPGPVKPEAEFEASRYWPTYQHYLDYRAAGALALTARPYDVVEQGVVDNALADASGR